MPKLIIAVFLTPDDEPVAKDASLLAHDIQRYLYDEEGMSGTYEVLEPLEYSESSLLHVVGLPANRESRKLTMMDAMRYCVDYHIDLSKDFHAYNSREVANVLAAADKHGYEVPKDANGSRGRCFYEALEQAVSKGINNES